MSRIFAILFGVVLGGVFVFMAFEYHVVRTRERILVVAKQRASLRDPFADVRTWTSAQWRDHSELADNLTAAGHGSVIARDPKSFFQDLLGPFRDKSRTK